MKKIDLHLHTVPTFSETDFEFSLPKLIEYVEKQELDAIAITNHDVFDLDQFRLIDAAVGIVVFPGIEVNLESGHILIISDGSNLESFAEKTAKVTSKIHKVGDYITVEELHEIFGELANYLVIPHYQKKPSLRVEILTKLKTFISAGEVDSAKKFIRAIKDPSAITPVLFSDARLFPQMTVFPTRQTYIDCGEITIKSLKASFKDKTKVALSRSEGNLLFQIFDNGQQLSSGLNVLLGGRSTGKTYTLDMIAELSESSKYIKQFSLVQQDEAVYIQKFNEDVARQRSLFVESFLESFKGVLNGVINIDVVRNHKQLASYIGTLLKSADEHERKDEFSKTVLFNETEFPQDDDSVLDSLIKSVRQLIENIEYRTVIDKHLNMEDLKALACELIEMLWANSLVRNKKKIVNSIVKDVKSKLKLRTSATQVEDVDLYRINLESKAVERFFLVVKALQAESVISEEHIQGFKIVATKRPFKGTGEIKDVSGKQVAFSIAFKSYEKPYSYLLELQNNESLTPSEFYKYFVKIDYEILNKDGYKVSGGERSEFRLLQEIKDAQNYDILLIDEPESSFDNVFLNSDVNQIIKEISNTMPVVVVTHNSTVGASIRPDYVIYSNKEKMNGVVDYRLYSGYPADKELLSPDGSSRNNFVVMMDSLEAGVDAYRERGQGYENIKN